MKKVNKRGIAAILATMVMMTGCGTSNGGSAAEVKPEGQNLASNAKVDKANVEYVNRFDETSDRPEDKEQAYYSDYTKMDKAALKIFAECLEENPNENVLISPFSLEMGLALVENGADGNNLSEMEKVIGGGLSINDMNRDLGYLSSNMTSNQDVDWNVANSIWVNTDNNRNIDLKEDYLNTVSKYYNPMVTGLPFDDAAKDQINGWVNDETYGMIPEILGETPQGRMVLVNAVAFKGEWETAFDDDHIYEDLEFTNADGSETNVTMLQGGCDRYFTIGDGIGFAVDYKGGDYSFIGILPPEDVEIGDYVQSLVDEDVSLVDSVEYFSTHECFYYLPEFKTEYSQEMTPTMQSLGMNEAFEEGADFSKLNDGGSLYISKIMHKTYIDVNREGTEAAAATAVEMTEGCVIADPNEPIVINLNRPFVYMIVDNTTNMPIFLGTQIDMN